MNPFSFSHASQPDEAVAAVSRDPHAKFVAGGTTLVDLLRLEVETPDRLVDVNALPLARIDAMPGGGVRIGALVRNSDLANDPTIRKRYPVISEALLSGASPQIRNMASVGGNLLQRTRCYYFRDPAYPCNKRVPGSGCSALEGFNRIHAVLGTSDKCIASFPGDMPVAMVALDAVVHTRRPNGSERAIPLTDFHVSYGDDPARESVLDHGELITAVDLPPTPGSPARTISRSATAPATSSPWRPPRWRSTSTAAASAPPAWRWAASAPSPGARPRPSARSPVRRRRRHPTGPPRKRPCRERSRAGTTDSRSSSPSAP